MKNKIAEIIMCDSCNMRPKGKECAVWDSCFKDCTRATRILALIEADRAKYINLLRKILHSGTWFISALELDDNCDGKELESEIDAVLKEAI